MNLAIFIEETIVKLELNPIYLAECIYKLH